MNVCLHVLWHVQKSRKCVWIKYVKMWKITLGHLWKYQCVRASYVSLGMPARRYILHCFWLLHPFYLLAQYQDNVPNVTYLSSDQICITWPWTGLWVITAAYKSTSTNDTPSRQAGGHQRAGIAVRPRHLFWPTDTVQAVTIPPFPSGGF